MRPPELEGLSALTPQDFNTRLERLNPQQAHHADLQFSAPDEGAYSSCT